MSVPSFAISCKTDSEFVLSPWSPINATLKSTGVGSVDSSRFDAAITAAFASILP